LFFGLGLVYGGRCSPSFPRSALVARHGDSLRRCLVIVRARVLGKLHLFKRSEYKTTLQYTILLYSCARRSPTIGHPNLAHSRYCTLDVARCLELAALSLKRSSGLHKQGRPSLSARGVSTLLK
jgi:hypothetical protein